jgi:hypothetical protein
VGDPVILTDRGPWYREAVTRAGFRGHVHRRLGCVALLVERFFGYLKDRSRVFYNNTNPKENTLHTSSRLPRTIRVLVH